MRLTLNLATLFALLLTLFASATIPIYYINMDDMTERARLMEQHLSELGLKATRVPGLTTRTCNILMLERMCKGHKGRMGFDEIAILCSHIRAIYTAVTDDSTPQARESKYALILEDDVRFSFAVDLNSLIREAPVDFGVLQLMTSHRDDFETVWEQFTGVVNQSAEAFAHSHFHKGGVDKEGIHAADKYNHKLWTFRDRQSTVWSAQAYVINKALYREFINVAVKPDRNGKLGYKILSHQDFHKKNEHANPYKPVIMSQCIFADMFVYSIGEPCYILNVPLFNGALVGHNSSYNLHQKHVAFHVRGFYDIYKAQEQLIQGEFPLPSFAKNLPASAQSTIRARSEQNWTTILTFNPLPAWAQSDQEEE